VTVADILRWLAETSLAISALIILVLLIRKPFAKAFGARAAYALWLAPAVRLFLPELKLLPAPPAPEAITQVSYAAPAETFFYTLPPVSAPHVFDAGSIAAAAALVIWATVAFAWFNMKLEAQSRFLSERKKASEPASAAIVAIAGELAERMKLRRLPAIRISNDSTGPCLIGLVRPVVFLPRGFEKDYADAEQRLVLAHELAHIARGDMLASFAALALQAMQWPNPLAHICFKTFRTDQEAACDAYVIARFSTTSNAAVDYAAAIMKSVRAGASAPAYGLSLAHPVKERLMLLKDKKKSPLRLMTGVAAVALFTAGSLAVTASYGYAAEKKDGKETTKVEEKIVRKVVLELEPGEKVDTKGISDKTRKIEISDENGARTVRTYDDKGNLIAENVYAAGADHPFEEITFISKDGEKNSISLAGPHGKMRKMVFMGEGGDGDHEKIIELMGDGAPMPPMAWNDEDHEVHMVRMRKMGDGTPMPPMPPMMMMGDGDAHFIGHCGDDGEGGDKTMVWNWTDEESGDAEDGPHMMRKEIICLDGDDAATPEKRAEALRKVITRMEADAKRQQEMIAKMKDELKKAEKESKK